MKEIFDFGSIKNLICGTGQTPLKVLINSMHEGIDLEKVLDMRPLG
jgi:hypothetical protein